MRAITSLPQDQDRQSGFARYQATRHFGSLDGLRFLCITAVLWHHAPIWTQMADPARILTRGFLGVDFFFVLSGFLITTLLLREEEAKGRFSLRGFYWRRILRIIPVYFLVVTAVGGYYIFVKGQTHYLAQWPYYYLFLSNFLTDHIPLLAPTWSLSVEEQYYMVWPLVLMLLPRRLILPILAGLIALNLLAVTGRLAGVGIVPFTAGPLRFEMFTATYTPILMGAGLGLILHRASGFALCARLFAPPAVPALLFVGLAVLIHILPPNLAGWPNLVLHLVMTACLACLVIREDNILRPMLTLRPVVWIGTISYGIYLYHLIALHIATVAVTAMGTLHPALHVLLYLGVTCLIAGFSFRYFERPILKLRHKSMINDP
ncbi:acyltransferase family protein [Roseobacter litoralis]|uniref:acyltransferase family protein n=1 Tax=Roseobacter litoralis TaxID=42443 RepID=UPI0024923080|nr:acyltransferase [Roseobacter litoralis]